MEKENCLIIFVKNPSFGKVKTRLSAEIGEAQAMAVYLKLVNHTMEICRDLDMTKTVYYSEFIDTEDEWENNIFEKSMQLGSDLGNRMKSAFAEQFDKGYNKVCIIGSDIPELSTLVINQAFEELDNRDVVIGPSLDGGYYLLGMKKLIPELFESKDWGSDMVLIQTLSNFEDLVLRYSQLEKLMDIDTKEDLLRAWPEFTWKEK